MRFTKALPTLVLLLALVAGTASAYISENPRQGLAPVSAEFHSEPTPREPGMILGFELRFLGFCVRSGLISTDPFGLSFEVAYQEMSAIPTLWPLRDRMACAYGLDDWAQLARLARKLREVATPIYNEVLEEREVQGVLVCGSTRVDDAELERLTNHQVHKFKKAIIQEFKDELMIIKTSNPDILVDDHGNIVLSHPKDRGKIIHTGRRTAIEDYVE